jgi:hypothetical protein
MDFKTALSRRLSIMQPTASDIERFLVEHPYRVTPGKLYMSHREEGGIGMGGTVGRLSRLPVFGQCSH